MGDLELRQAGVFLQVFGDYFVFVFLLLVYKGSSPDKKAVSIYVFFLFPRTFFVAPYLRRSADQSQQTPSFGSS